MDIHYRDTGLGFSYTITAQSGGVVAYGERDTLAECKKAVRDHLFSLAIRTGRRPETTVRYL